MKKSVKSMRFVSEGFGDKNCLVASGIGMTSGHSLGFDILETRWERRG